MKYGIYIDVLFLTNFMMDFLSLWIVKKLLKNQGKMRYLFLASLFGTIGSIALYLLLKQDVAYQLCVHFMVNPVMVFIAYQSRNFKKYVMEYFFSYLGVIVLGGALQWTFSGLSNRKGYWIWVIAITLAISAGITLWERMWAFREQTFQVMLVHKDYKVLLDGFYDTGNLLDDPYVHQPVHIVEEGYIQPIIEQFDLKPRYVPYHSLGKQNGLLKVVTLDYMYIRRGKEDICIEKPVCGISKEALFQSHMCQILLNARCMK
ncbi:sigma-E processing peptidase SpoIIGA [Lachnospiraceae bacterium ZAX-1]